MLEVLPDGTVLLPRGLTLADLAEALGDEKAKVFCEQATSTEVLIGKRMCG